MINEDYVSFETARLLKEKGFDVWGDGSYDSGIEIYKEYSPSGLLNSCATSKPHPKGYPAPTLQMVMKWLNKVHEIFIRPNISFLYPIRYYCEIFCYGDNLKTQQDVTTERFESPEEACEAAIRYCLEKFDLGYEKKLYQLCILRKV